MSRTSDECPIKCSSSLTRSSLRCLVLSCMSDSAVLIVEWRFPVERNLHDKAEPSQRLTQLRRLAAVRAGRGHVMDTKDFHPPSCIVRNITLELWRILWVIPESSQSIEFFSKQFSMNLSVLALWTCSQLRTVDQRDWRESNIIAGSWLLSASDLISKVETAVQLYRTTSQQSGLPIHSSLSSLSFLSIKWLTSALRSLPHSSSLYLKSNSTCFIVSRCYNSLPAMISSWE